MSSKILPVCLNRIYQIFINRNFFLLWSGQMLSVFGDFIFGTTLILWIIVILAHTQSWTPLAVSGIILAQSLPRILIQPLAGVFVDRWDKRHLMLWMDCSRAILIALLLFVGDTFPVPFVPTGHLPLSWQLGMIYAIVFVVSACTQFFNPAQFALIGDIVPQSDLARASGRNLILVNVAMIIGPSLAAPLFFGFGIHLALSINALSFAISFLTILLIHPPTTKSNGNVSLKGSVQRELYEGIHFLAGNTLLRTVTISLIIAMFGIGALNALDVFFIVQNLRASTTLYGFLGAAFGIGSIVGAILSSFLVPRLGFTRAFWSSMIAVGIFILVFARMTSILPALIVFALLGIPNAANNVALEPLLFQATPRPLIGRIFAVLTPAYTLAYIVSVTLSGYIESSAFQHFHATILGITSGPIDTLLTGTGLLVIMGGIYAMFVLPTHTN